MTAQGISGTVTRAFQAFGLIFMLGGIFFGSILVFTAPEVLQVQALVQEVTVEKRRPLGFEDIPIDSTDPAHAAIPIYTDVWALVRYTLDGGTYSSEISSPVEDPGWYENEYIPVYVVTDQPDAPLPYYPKDAGSRKRHGILAGLALFAVGCALFLVSFFDRRRALRSHRDLLQKLDAAGINPGAAAATISAAASVSAAAGAAAVSAAETTTTAGTARENIRIQDRQGQGEDILHEADFKGGWGFGGILTGIGAVLTAVSLSQLAGNAELEEMERIMMLFPLIVGFLLMYTGSREFYRIRVEIRPGFMVIRRKLLFSEQAIEKPLSSFYGLYERVTEMRRLHSMKRYFFREYTPVHLDPSLSEITLYKIDDTPDAWGRLMEFSKKIGLPVISEENGELRIHRAAGEDLNQQDPLDHQNGPKEAASSAADSNTPWPLQPGGISARDPFPSKYLTLRQDDEDGLTVTRSYKKALVWGLALWAAAGGVAIAAGSAIVLLPFGMMGLIFIAISGKFDYFSIQAGKIQFEERFYGYLYNQVSISCSDVERVAIDGDPRRHMARSLVINSRDERIIFGQSAGKEELEWLADRVKRVCRENA